MSWQHGMTPYEVLRINNNASAETIVEAYRKLIVTVHPDRNPSAEALSQFKLILEAYELLSDPVLKYAYDQEPISTFSVFFKGPFDFKIRKDRSKSLLDASWKHDLMSGEQFHLILQLQRDIFDLDDIDIHWDLLFDDCDQIEPSKGNACLMLEYLLDHVALRSQSGKRWEEMAEVGVCDIESLRHQHRRLSMSIFSGWGWSVLDQDVIATLNEFKAPHIAEQQYRAAAQIAGCTLRDICAKLPEVRETRKNASLAFAAGRKVFAYIDRLDHQALISLYMKSRRAEEILADVKYSRDPISRPDSDHQWVRLPSDMLLDKPNLEKVVIESYRSVALNRMLQALDNSELAFATSVRSSEN